jgi:hypothetical protein
MKLQDGKYYALDDGRVVGPVWSDYANIDWSERWAVRVSDGVGFKVCGLPNGDETPIVSVIEERKFPEPLPPTPIDFGPFLAELSALTMKYGFAIESCCRCCGCLPYLSDGNVRGRYITDKYGDNLEWRDG